MERVRPGERETDRQTGRQRRDRQLIETTEG